MAEQEPRTQLKDRDSVETAFRVKALVWLIPVSLIFAGFAAAAAIQIGAGGRWGLLIALAVIPVTFLFYFGVVGRVIDGTASFIGQIYGGSRSPPEPTPRYWRAEARVARGDIQGALEAYEEEAREFPSDPRLPLKAASLCAEELKEPEAAVEWYLRARAIERLDPETDAYVTSRLTDLYELELDDDESAAREMRRLIREHPDSRYTARARARLAGIRRRQRDEMD